MQYQRFDNTLLVRLDKGDDISACLLTVAQNEHITLGSVSGIGATDCFTVGVFDTETKQYIPYTYTQNHEINALVGNFSQKDGKPYLHLHITCTGPAGNVVGGHLLAGTISLTAEIFVDVVQGNVERTFDPQLGINGLTL